MSPTHAEWLLGEMFHAWLLDIESVPYPVSPTPQEKGTTRARPGTEVH